MNNTYRILVLAITACFTASPAFGAGAAKRPQPKPMELDSSAVNAIKSFDKDHNFEIDLKELPAVQAAFKASPNGNLKQFDKGGDGVLDETVDRASMNIKLAAAKMAGKEDGDSAGPARKRKKK